MRNFATLPRLPDHSRPLDRWDIERAVKRATELPPIAAHLLLDLCTYLDQGSARLPYNYSPSITGICADTGWTRRTVTRWLAYLEESGWLVRVRPTKHDAQVKHSRTAYSLVLPERLGPHSDQARAAQRPGLGAVGDQARAAQRPGLGAVSPEARDGVTHNQTSPDTPDQPDPIAGFIAVFFAGLGHQVSPETAEAIGRQILARPSAAGKDPLKHVRRTLATDPHPQRWLSPQTKGDDPK